MIYGLVSDIHGNLESLETVLAALPRIDGLLCLGDIVGYGPDPAACLERLREQPGLLAVVGNHDLAACGRYDQDWFNPYAREAIIWTAEQLSAEQKQYLASLPMTLEVAGATLVHGSLPEPMDYITGPREALGCFDALSDSLCFVGHTHVAELYRLRRHTRFCDQVSLWSGGRVVLDPDLRYIINVGAVGQPRDGNPDASFGVWDTEARVVEVTRVAYDIAAVQRKMRAARLPGYLVQRLADGR
jgi:diadenosine tetraphosphatase ApaH/serine/threonine PP2A family protein phosphatase